MKPPISWKFKPVYLGLSIGLLVILVLIALFVHDAIVRPFFGDVLSVIWLYLTLRTVLQGPTLLLAAGCVVAACLVELSQWLNLTTHLGVQDNVVLSTILGATFDPLDLVAYVLGGVLVVVIEYVLGRRAGVDVVNQDL